MNLLQHEHIKLLNSFLWGFLKYKLDHIVAKHVIHERILMKINLFWYLWHKSWYLVSIWCACFSDCLIVYLFFNLIELFFIINHVFEEGIDDCSVGAGTSTELNLDKLRADLVTTEFTCNPLHLTQKCVSQGFTTRAALVKDVVLDFALYARSSTVLRWPSSMFCINRFEVLQLLVSLDQRLHSLESSHVVIVIIFGLQDALDGPWLATDARLISIWVDCNTIYCHTFRVIVPSARSALTPGCELTHRRASLRVDIILLRSAKDFSIRTLICFLALSIRCVVWMCCISLLHLVSLHARSRWWRLRDSTSRCS